jgi:hypothetical protein
MITAKDILDLQRRAPFQPFSIHMSDGRKVDVHHPEMMLVYRNSVVVAEKDPDENEIPESGERLSILHIARLSGVEVS